jgi:hypothetical protein
MIDYFTSLCFFYFSASSLSYNSFSPVHISGGKNIVQKQLQVYGAQPAQSEEQAQQVLRPKQASAYLAERYGIAISASTLRRMAREGVQAVLLSPPGSKRLHVGFATETLDKLAQGQLFDISKLYLRNRRRKCPHQVLDCTKTKAVTGGSSSPTSEATGAESARVSKTRLKQMLGL